MDIHPVNKKQKRSLYWSVQIGGWLLYYIAYSLLQLTAMGATRNLGFLKVLFVEVLLAAATSHWMRTTIIKKGILGKSLNRQIRFLLLYTFLFSFFFSLVDTLIGIIGNSGQVRHSISIVSLVAVNWVTGFMLLLIWSLLYFAYHYVMKSNQEALEKMQLENIVKDLELKTIKAHVNPHFIFNALNSIRALVEENPQRARTAITELSHILRSSMRTDKKKTTSLQEELEIVKDYLALEGIRFEDRLQVEYFIPEAMLAQELPPMTLQTMVENAIKHGISQQVNGGTIRIRVRPNESYCAISVENTGQLLSSGKKQSGFGIVSTRNRLRLLFGDQAHFYIRSYPDNRVEATMELPLTVKPDQESTY